LVAAVVLPVWSPRCRRTASSAGWRALLAVARSLRQVAAKRGRALAGASCRCSRRAHALLPGRGVIARRLRDTAAGRGAS